MSGYLKRFSKCMFFKKNDELFKKYTEIRDKVSNNIKKGFDSELVYNEKYQKKQQNNILSMGNQYKPSWWWNAKRWFPLHLLLGNIG